MRLFLLFTMISSLLQAGVVSTIQQVTVFQHGAQIERTATLQVEKGISTIKIGGLSSYFDANTIQAKIPGVKILEIKSSFDYVSDQEESIDVQQITSSLKKIELEIEQENAKKQTLELEMELILANKSIKGEESLDLLDLKEFVAYYKTKIPELKNQMLDVDRQLRKFYEVQSKLKKQLQEVQQVNKTAVGIIELTISSETSRKSILDLKYVVKNCGWTPFYNIRAKDLNQPTELEYNANVYQNTGVGWNNVKIILATGNPTSGGIQPNLNTWMIGNEAFGRRQDYNYSHDLNMEYKAAAALEDDELGKASIKSKARIQNTQSQSLTYNEFIIAEPYTIISNEKPTRIEIIKHQLPTSYQYYAVPKLDKGVYLLAEITNWQQLALLPGATNIYYKEAFVGKSYLDPAIEDDTLNVSMGIDNSIFIERTKLNDASSVKTFAGTKTTVSAYEITIKNNRTTPIQIKVLDQAPKSNDSKIKIEILETGNAKLDEESGILEWNLEVPAGQKISTSFKFEVKHPKKYRVTL